MRTVLRLAAATALTAAALATAMTATASTAAASTQSGWLQKTHFDVPYYNTYVVGDIYWYDRSVTIEGTARGQAGSCRRVYGKALDAANQIRDERSTSTICNATVPVTMQLTLDAVGGPTQVEIDLDDTTPITLEFALCKRTGCTTYRA